MPLDRRMCGSGGRADGGAGPRPAGSPPRLGARHEHHPRTTVRRVATTAVLAGAAVLTAAPAFAAAPPEDTGLGLGCSQRAPQADSSADPARRQAPNSRRLRRCVGRDQGRKVEQLERVAAQQQSYAEHMARSTPLGRRTVESRRDPSSVTALTVLAPPCSCSAVAIGRRRGRVHRVPVPAPRAGRCSHRVTGGWGGRVPGRTPGTRPRMRSHHRPSGGSRCPFAAQRRRVIAMACLTGGPGCAALRAWRRQPPSSAVAPRPLCSAPPSTAPAAGWSW